VNREGAKDAKGFWGKLLFPRIAFFFAFFASWRFNLFQFGLIEKIFDGHRIVFAKQPVLRYIPLTKNR